MVQTDTGSGRELEGGSRQWLILAGLAIYTGLLVLGTIGELFHIDWILNIPIFRGP